MIKLSRSQWHWLKIADDTNNTNNTTPNQAEGVQSVVATNQYGRKFFTIFGNTFPIKDKLTQIKDMVDIKGRPTEVKFKYFKGTWGIPVEFVTDKIKSELQALGIDTSSIAISAGIEQEKEPVQEQTKIPPAEKSMVDKELERMKDGIAMAMKEESNARVRGLTSFVDRMIERVAQMTDEVAQKDFVKSFLLFSAKFHDYSYNNQMLIWVQKPTATYVKGHKQWIELGRQVSNWDAGITIISPRFTKAKEDPTNPDPQDEGRQVMYFAADKVYDISDTTPIPNWQKMKGKAPFEVPPLKKDSNEAKEEITVLVNSIVTWAKKNNIDVGYEKMKESLGGWSSGGTIKINDTFQGINLFSTMVHEAAHEILHWIQSDTGKTKVRPSGQPESRQVKEIDAETTAYIVLQHYGFETTSAPDYLALWKAKGEDIKARRDNIRKAVVEIIDGIEASMKTTELTEDTEEQPKEPQLAKSNNTIKLSKAQWEMIGKKVGWIK